jgi:hypothetical protein
MGYDPRAYYQPPTAYDPRYPQPVGLPPTANPHMGYGRPPTGMSYPNPYMYNPGMAQIQAEDNMVNQAINILLQMQSNPGALDMPEKKAIVNKLLETQSVHQRVKKYFEDLKKP